MKKKILVVERDKNILEILSYILTEAGYQVSLSQTGEGVFEQILKYRPDAVLLDIIRPSVEGTELCRRVKASGRTKHIPVIVLSTHMKIDIFKDVCADEVIAKPFDIDELINIIDKTLSLA